MPDQSAVDDQPQGSIYAYILGHLPPDGPGLEYEGHFLPDEEPRSERVTVRLAPGMLDKILDPGSAADSERVAAACFRSIEAAIDDPGQDRFDELVDALRPIRPMGFLDPLVAKVASACFSRRDVRDLGLRLATRSAYRTAVKTGIALLALSAEGEDRAVLLTLGRHEEFTSYAGVTLTTAFDDSEASLWQLARLLVHQGRISLVRQLASTQDPEIKAWILRESWRGIGNDELAFIAATTGELVEQLRADTIDEDLCRCAGAILSALIEGRLYLNWHDIDDYADGPEAIPRFVAHVSRGEERLEFFEAVAMIVDYLELRESLYRNHWTPERFRVHRPGYVPPHLRPPVGWSDGKRARTATSARSLLARPAWRRLAEEALRSPDPQVFAMGEQAARWLGIDTMPSILDRLRDVPNSDAVWYTAVGIADEGGWQQLLDLAAERVLRHDDAPDESVPWWTAIVQAMERFPGTGGPLFYLALDSPVPNHKAFGLRGLHALMVDAWPPGADALVEEIARSDPDQDRRRWATEVLASRSG